jgi:ABC-type multidrug transport system fused ATPase/permease subunit
VAFVAVFTDLYWKFTLFVFLPVLVVDTVWDAINFVNYRKKYQASLNEEKEEKD